MSSRAPARSEVCCVVSVRKAPSCTYEGRIVSPPSTRIPCPQVAAIATFHRLPRSLLECSDKSSAQPAPARCRSHGGRSHTAPEHIASIPFSYDRARPSDGWQCDHHQVGVQSCPKLWTGPTSRRPHGRGHLNPNRSVRSGSVLERLGLRKWAEQRHANGGPSKNFAGKGVAVDDALLPAEPVVTSDRAAAPIDKRVGPRKGNCSSIGFPQRQSPPERPGHPIEGYKRGLLDSSGQGQLGGHVDVCLGHLIRRRSVSDRQVRCRVSNRSAVWRCLRPACD